MGDCVAEADIIILFGIAGDMSRYRQHVYERENGFMAAWWVEEEECFRKVAGKGRSVKRMRPESFDVVSV